MSDLRQPSDAELIAYRHGTLSRERFAAVDHWLAQLSEADQERLLSSPDSAEPDLVGLSPPPPTGPIFLPEALAQRFIFRERLAAGGMGLIELVYDRVLERDVALKRCRPRGPDESLASHALRVRLFRREAAITAQLEHPGIVPVHDVGLAPAGEPAYVMKRLTGSTLSACGKLTASTAVDVLLRVADAIAYAHHQGIVHRDLKPDNIWLGRDGAVYVLDWGLAGAIGSTLDASGELGTPPWRAPEQTAETPADPRMDVWALGGLLVVALTGEAPILPPSHDATGLRAIAQQCLQLDPAARYPDGAAVAADLRRFLAEGVAAAERQSWPLRLARAARQRPLLTSALLVSVLGGSQWLTMQWLARQSAERTASAFLESPLPEAAERPRLISEFATLPSTPGVMRARDRLRLAQETEHILASALRFQRTGPWPSQVADLTTTLRVAGIDPLMPAAAERLAQHPHRHALLRVLVQLQQALLVGRSDSPLIKVIPALIDHAAPDAAWRSLADLLTRPIISSHDLELCQCDASEAALHQADTADVLLAVYAPDARLDHLANQRLGENPGAFWPRIVAARAALSRQDPTAANAHALVALGADPLSLWPHLILAYVALDRDNAADLARETAAAAAANPDHLEVKTLQAVVLARSGRLSEAQHMIDGLHEAAHLQHHLQHRMGHPMERTVAALVAAGIVIPAATPEAGPVVRPHLGE